jgi:hypothetical protein
MKMLGERRSFVSPRCRAYEALRGGAGAPLSYGSVRRRAREQAHPCVLPEPPEPCDASAADSDRPGDGSQREGESERVHEAHVRSLSARSGAGNAKRGVLSRSPGLEVRVGGPSCVMR